MHSACSSRRLALTVACIGLVGVSVVDAFLSTTPACGAEQLVRGTAASCRSPIGARLRSMRPGFLGKKQAIASVSLSARDSSMADEPPVIDLAALNTGDLSTDSPEVQLVAAAASRWGFFQIVNHGVDAKLLADFDRVTTEFFSLEKEQKYQVKRTSDNSRGYFDDELTKQTLDWKEAFDVGSQGGSLDAASDVDGFNQWPEAPSDFTPVVREYFSEVTDLSSRLLRVLAVGLGQEAGFFDDQIAAHSSYLRLNHYPPCPTPVDAAFPLRSPTEAEGFLAINRHTDAGLLTILRQKHDEPNSLQVYMSEDLSCSLSDSDAAKGRWINISPVEGAFTINIGDMMQVISNDKYRAPLHRVLANKERHRYSAPYFFNPPYEVDCNPMSSLGSPLYNVVNWGEFRRRRFEGDFSDQGVEVQISQYRTEGAPSSLRK